MRTVHLELSTRNVDFKFLYFCRTASLEIILTRTFITVVRTLKSGKMSWCKCSKSDDRMGAQSSPYLEEITSRIEERRCGLIGRQNYLRDKVTTMERSIPALLAYNMWTSSQNCKDPLYCKVREIMKQFSPHPDPADRLVEDLEKTVKQLNEETADFHEKIIDVDVKLEETDMQLESLELANREMNNTLTELEREVRSYSSPSLHSIHSDDLICLAKIQKLAKEELNLKNCIKEFERKELLLREQVDRIFVCRDAQPRCNPCRSKVNYGVVEDNAKSVNHETKQIGEGRTEKKSSWISNWWGSSKTGRTETTKAKKTEKSISTNTGREEAKSCICSTPVLLCYEKEPQTVQTTATRKPGNYTNLCKPCGKSNSPPSKSRNSYSCCAGYRMSGRSCSCAVRETACKKLYGSLSKSKCAPSKIPCVPPSCGPLDSGTQVCKSLATSPAAPCKAADLQGTRLSAVDDYRCICTDREHQLPALKATNTKRRSEDSDEESCECCYCQCDDSDMSLSCLCN